MGQNAKLTDFSTDSDEEVDLHADKVGNSSSSDEPEPGKYKTPEYEATGKKLNTVHSVPPKCLSFSVNAPFAHFRKVETSSTRLTYGIPPRTTLNGMIAAILGLEVNSYYELFGLKHSAMSITVEEPLREINMPIKHRNTDPDVMKSESGKVLTIEHEPHPSNMDSDEAYQRVAHSMLRNVQYRVDIWVSSKDIYEELKELLETGKSVYTPTLGLSECLASIEYHGEFTPENVENDSKIKLDSIFPSSAGRVPLESNSQVTTEQTPAEMELVSKGINNRRTTEFSAYQYRENGETLTVNTDYAAVVDNRTVVFK